MKKENRVLAVSQIFCGYDDIEYLLRHLASVIAPAREQEDDSLWDITNRVCDQYLCPTAA